MTTSSDMHKFPSNSTISKFEACKSFTIFLFLNDFEFIQSSFHFTFQYRMLFNKYLNKINYILQNFIEIQEEILIICNESNFTDIKEVDVNSFMELLEKHTILTNKIKLKEFLHFFSHFISYHKHTELTIQIMQKIILSLKDIILSHITQSELCLIFHQTPSFILFLYENGFLTKDIFLRKYIFQLNSPESLAYFYPEYSFLQYEDRYLYKKLIKKFKTKNYHPQEYDLNHEKFLEKRKKQINESEIAEMIRNDMIDDFISLFSSTKLNINTKIKISYFQSDSYLLSINNNPLKRPTLLDYSAYFGSIHIFKFLFIQNAKITQNTWFFAIHGNNHEIIHLLETKSTDIKYNLCFLKAIYFHNNEIASYLKEQFLSDDFNVNRNLSNFLESYNYLFITDKIDEIKENEFSQEDFESFIIDLCIYGYNSILEKLIIDSNVKEIIQNIKGSIFIFFIYLLFLFILFLLNQTLLHIAVQSNNYDAVCLLLEFTNIDVNSFDIIFNSIFLIIQN